LFTNISKLLEKSTLSKGNQNTSLRLKHMNNAGIRPATTASATNQKALDSRLKHVRQKDGGQAGMTN
jgi:hypothetical protein